MEAKLQVLEARPNVSPISELCCDHDNDKMEHMEAEEFLESDSAVQERSKKKKKKHRGGLQSPNQIIAFNTSELLKLDEHKAETRKCVTGSNKTLSKSASFSTNATLKINCPLMESSGDSEDVNEYAMSSSPVKKIPMLTRATSLPLKSALRGSFEELGIGPRPKLHVKWAPSVWEPPCSTISHTLVQNQSKKKDTKHGHRGKSSRDDLHKKQSKRKPHKTKCNSGSSMLMRHGLSLKDGGKVVEAPMLDDMSSSGSDTLMMSSSMVLVDFESKDVESCDVNSRLAIQSNSDVADQGLAAVCSLQYPLESTCGGSLFGSERVPCNFLYGQAL